jgi:hypothetical protein
MQGYQLVRARSSTRRGEPLPQAGGVLLRTLVELALSCEEAPRRVFEDEAVKLSLYPKIAASPSPQGAAAVKMPWWPMRSEGERPRQLAYNVGLMFWLSRNRFVGSYLFLKATSRS